MKNKTRQRGQAFAEYLVGVLLLLAALFTPVDGAGGPNAVQLLTDAFQRNYRGYEYVMSQPSGE